MSALDRLFRPQWAGGWAATRGLWAVVALLTWVPRGFNIPDAYAAPDMAFAFPPFYLANHYILTQPTAYGIWAALLAGCGLVLWGGRLTRPGLLLWGVSAWTLLAAEAINVKAYDRLLTWMALALLFSPAAERGLAQKHRAPTARWFLMLVYCALYGSTGWLKALEEPGWLTGETLAYHLIEPDFGGKPLGVLLSTQRWLVAPMGWWAVITECTFPLLIWFRRTNPWILLALGLMHLGIYTLMNVGTFSWVALAGYPVLLHPELSQRLWEKVAARVRPP